MSAEIKWTSDQVDMLLRNKYCAPCYAYLSEVREGTGFSRDGFVDGLAMSLWPSKGLDLTGFEIKVSRSDWLREIQNPLKAEAFSKFCHWWYIVAAPGLVKLEELPALWGLMEPVGDILKIRRPATKRADRIPPDDILLASIMRKVTQESPQQLLLEKTRRESFESGRQQGIHQEKNAHLDHRYDRLFKAVNEFEEKSGVKIDDWKAGDIGEAVKIAMQFKDIRQNITWNRDGLQNSLKRLDALLAGKVEV